MIAFRALQERPVVGGEKFSAVIGPAPAFRRVTRLALVLSLLAVAGGALGLPSGLSPWLLGGGVLFATAFASAWVSGGPEALVCQGTSVLHRRVGPLRGRERSWALRELRSIETPAGRGWRRFTGVRLGTARGDAVFVGRGLPAEDAAALAQALRRHLASRDLPRVELSVPPPERAAVPGSLERVRSRR